MRSIKLTAAALSFGAASLFAGRARAGADCTKLPNPIYVAGSTAIKSTLAQIAVYLSAQAMPVTVVYAGTGSCSGVASVINTASPNPTPLQTPVGSTNFFTYWNTPGSPPPPQSCDINTPDGGSPVYLNIGLSDVFATTCAGVVTFPPNVTDYQGPVQAMTFVVPNGSTENAISAEAAYFVFGFGGKGQNPVAPWITDMTMYQRGASSGTQSMIAKAISVPPASWYGNTESSTSNMVSAITGANSIGPQQRSSIGIMAAEDVDTQRVAVLMGTKTDTPRELAYRHIGQNCAYLPDSAPNLFDKLNVRDGHYAIWGPVHAFPLPAVDPTVKANIATVVGLLTGTAQTSAIDLITFEAQNGIVPQCAMRVARTQEVGPMTPVSQPNPCGCYYEHVANGYVSKDTTCTPCKTVGDCPASYSCQIYDKIGYCEPP